MAVVFVYFSSLNCHYWLKKCLAKISLNRLGFRKDVIKQALKDKIELLLLMFLRLWFSSSLQSDFETFSSQSFLQLLSNVFPFRFTHRRPSWLLTLKLFDQKFRESPSIVHQLVIGSDFGYFSVFQNNNLIHLWQVTDAVGYQDSSFLSQSSLGTDNLEKKIKQIVVCAFSTDFTVSLLKELHCCVKKQRVIESKKRKKKWKLLK